MTSNETPPEWMWSVDHELESWFTRIEHERNEKYGIDDGHEHVPLMENELAKQMRERRRA